MQLIYSIVAGLCEFVNLVVVAFLLRLVIGQSSAVFLYRNGIRSVWLPSLGKKPNISFLDNEKKLILRHHTLRKKLVLY